jgi:RNA polymerase sigma-70 factor (ECF subfamily)
MSPVPPDPVFSERPRDAALANLHRRFRVPLLAFFRRRVANGAEAEDLVQDVFERLLRTLEAGPIHNADSYVFKIAINLLRDRARSVRRHGIDEPLPADTAAEFADALAVDLSPERVVLAERTLEEVLAVLDELPERTRAMFYVYRFENLKIREIAVMYGNSPSAVEKQVANALMYLMRRLRRK